ncbi:YdiU family protein [Legionella sp. km772]|uniref:protein adenylyltransferase SelO n=1 Tax=Legionella sp. km772 TaxID=2498111 RepID=UPI000F8E59E8|nr:YdiU family protein [Legionella sp. km772]RUR08093.1 YdiU family protein [Legionella sp. km772]
MSTLHKPQLAWNFDNSYARLPEHFFTRLLPLKVRQPQVVVLNDNLSEQLGLNLQACSQEELAQVFSGNQLPKGADPISQAYAGHQFGYFTFLGDGRAHLIGEHKTPNGSSVDVQLKGSGQTPYGRRGDGRAALGPMLREYIISEAMHALGIPTTRSLAVVTTGEPVYRETVLQGAILTRIAASHLRVGTFEQLAANNDVEGLKILADYAIERHYPQAKEAANPYLHLLKMVIEKQAELITHWMRVGFIHGVMNTDNMAISGETIDYGPCAFMDFYDPSTVFSSIDEKGRYCYVNQPGIAQWNLARFAETLLPLLHEQLDEAIELAKNEVSNFTPLYEEKWFIMMRAKLGLFGQQNTDSSLIGALLYWMQKYNADYTNTFRALSQEEMPTGSLYDEKAFKVWYEHWQLRLKANNKPFKFSLDLMNSHNPLVIPRNHKVNQALDAAANGNFKPFNTLVEVLKDPYTSRPGIETYQHPPTPDERIHHTFCGT